MWLYLTLLGFRVGPAQVRGMEDVSFCSIIGIAGMLLALVIAAAKLFVLRVDDYAPTHWLRKCAHRDSRRSVYPAAVVAACKTCSMVPLCSLV